MLKFFNSTGKKKLDNAKINTYTTLADFYLKNGYKKEARATLEDMARYYDSIGYDAEAKKTMLLAAKINSPKQARHPETVLLDNTGKSGEKQHPPHQGDASAHGGAAENRATGSVPSADRTGEFFDLESALAENYPCSFSSTYDSAGPSSSVQSVTVPSKTPAAIFREIKISTDGNREEHGLDFHYTLGIAHQQLRQFDDAIEEFTAALANLKSAAAQEPAAGATTGDCYQQLVICYDALNKRAKAEQYAGKALTLNSLTVGQRLFFKQFMAGAGEKGPGFLLSRQLVHIKSALYRLYNSALT